MGLMSSELNVTYSGGGEASLSRKEATWADSLVEWLYSFIRVSTGVSLNLHCAPSLNCLLGAWINSGRYAMADALTERIAELTGIPQQNCERLYL